MNNEAKKNRFFKLLEKEKKLAANGYFRVAGVDEAGRGPLAGPVVAAAVCANVFVDFNSCDFDWFYDVFDSKAVPEKKRETLFELITADDSPFHFGIGVVDHKIIDEINILKATHKAMKMAVEQLVFPPDYILVDGTEIPDIDIQNEKVIKGDSKCFCIAAASILAKVTRDRIMYDYARKFPAYNFDKNKGYGTKNHIDSIRAVGRCEIHRKSFKVAGLDEDKKKK